MVSFRNDLVTSAFKVPFPLDLMIFTMSILFTSFKTSVLYYNRTNVLMSNIDDTPMADAIYDRPLHHAYKTDMRSDSMRIIKRPLVKTDKKEVIERENKLS